MTERHILHATTPGGPPPTPLRSIFSTLSQHDERHFMTLLAPLIPHGAALMAFSATGGQFGPLRFTSRPAGNDPHAHPHDRLLLAAEDDSSEITCMISNAAGDTRVYPGALDTLHAQLTQRGRIHQLTAEAAVDYLNAHMYGLFDTPGGHSELILDQLRDANDTSLNATVKLHHTGGHSVTLLLRVDSADQPHLRLSKPQHPEPIARSEHGAPPVTWHARYAQAFRKAAQP